jgi:hypothetical protein
MARPSDYCGGVEAYMYLGDLEKPLAPDSWRGCLCSSRIGRELGHEANHFEAYSSPLRYDSYEFVCYCLV